MLLDRQLSPSINQAVTASAASTDYIDLGVAREIGGMAKPVLGVFFPEGFTAAGAATLDIQVQVDDNTSFSSPRTVASTGALAVATLTAGRAPVYFALPLGTDERYLRLNYVVATGPMTAGRVTAGFVADAQHNRAYADGI